MRLISWNVAGRQGRQPEQARMLTDRAPDLVALQEVTAASQPRWSAALREVELAHIVTSQERCSGRKYFNLIASKFPLGDLVQVDSPYPERVLSATVGSPAGTIELHTAHIPPGSTRGWKKIETLNAIYNRLARPSESHRILCGDFNTPQSESDAGEVVTFADRRPRRFDEWDKGERQILTGLAEFDLPDVFRRLNTYKAPDKSWYVRRRGGDTVGRRFDHVFASVSLGAKTCEYHHQWREDGLSDHAAIEVLFDPERR